MLRLGPELTARRQTVAHTAVLDRAAARLEQLLGDLGTGEVYVPDEKALLSRDGGVCPDDGSRLLFDPDSPHAHRCGRCGRTVSGARHHRAWIMRYQIWLSERAIHLALLGALRDPGCAVRGARILGAYAARYEGYPNEDNVLGPSRPFFSTYLESIWLTQLSIARTVLDASGAVTSLNGDWDAVDRMLRASADLIAGFDEGWSNRQVWNSTALLAAGMALHEDVLVRSGLVGLRRLLRAVDDGGMWHEGENYHLFALRGFLLGAECARWVGDDLYDDSPLGAMYGAPLATLLPDFTLPARGDAPFGVSVAQPRFAELWEIGRARTGDHRLDAVLAALYAADLPEHEDRGRAELAEQEENHPAARQRRDALGWKALLWMRPEEPQGEAVAFGSTVQALPSIVVLRPESQTVVSVESGNRAGGHGHPDLLHLSLFRRTAVLADFGTASYVDPSLHWYRSTLAHNAPGVRGRGQWPARAIAEGADAQGRWAWCRVGARGLLGPDTTVVRTILTGSGQTPHVTWLLDVLTVDAPADTTVDLALHPLGGVPAGGASPELVHHEAVGHETGYGHLQDVRVTPLPDAIAAGATDAVTVRFVPRPGEVVLTADAPGPPGSDFGPGAPLRFLIRRAAGSGRWIQCVSWGDPPPTVGEREGAIEIVQAGRRVRVQETPDGLTVRADGESPQVFAARTASAPDAPPPSRAVPIPECEVPLWPDDAEPFAANLPSAEWDLGEGSYRQSEQSHTERGATAAAVSVAAQGETLVVRVRVAKPVVVVRAADAPDPALDNEPADIHSDGVQIFVERDRWMGVLAVPELDTEAVRVRGVRGTAPVPGGVIGTSRRTEEGYEMLLRVPTGAPWRRGDRFAFTVTVNEMVPGRERRSGQLALAGGGWVWLRGDRESPGDAVTAGIA